jgi:hypothetical protein
VGTCESPRVKITATIKPNPTISLIITQPTLCGPSTGSLEVCSPVADFKYTLGSTTITAVAGQPVKFTGLAAGSNPGVSVEHTNGCTNSATCASATATCPTSGNTSSIQSADRIEPTDQQQSVETVNAQIPLPTRVSAVPNPFNSKIKFSLESAVSGEGSLEIYNILGQKVKTVFKGYVQKGQVQSVEYEVPNALRSNLIYIFRVGDQRVTGKLVGLK